MKKTLAAVLLAALSSSLIAQETLLYETNSLYHHIVVSQTESERILRFHKGDAGGALGKNFAQSIISLHDPYELHMNYAKHCMIGAALADNPKRALFVGLGAGSMPKFFARIFPDCRVDVAEIDEKVVQVARRFFFLPDIDNMKTSVMDGRRFIRRSSEKYDIVFLDAYRDQMIPFHLMTKDFFEELKEKLAPGALLVSNLAVKDNVQLYPWLLRTYQHCFGTLFEARVPRTFNKILLAWPEKAAASKKDITDKAAAFAAKTTLGFPVDAPAAAYKDVSSEKASERLLTDDYAPVNLMKIKKADEKDWEY